ncbi:MAG: 5-deoxyadenosylcobinamide phosphate nucleotidyltransferase [Candidatus Nitrosopelagicus sp.]|jgi:adenosylcobinamide-phosphate guanylyltransferase|nr:MAG: 5-deoxyadenosylcobinamide phosphate nucleotidyltransferase [Candidatus Nitrosopelagicus sp.]|tara:strand:+ start:423 stop:1007 length:585 start_codon:yes stop_codon:yes gene_type:complete
MIGLVMAGGKGTRMKSNEEKLLLPYKQPLVLHVIDALKNSNCFEKIIAATSPNSPQTKNILVENNITIIETSGEGFVTDLNNILKQLDDFVLVSSGDLPLLDGDIIKQIIDNVNHDKTWTSIVTTKSFQNSLNLEPECISTLNDEDYAHTGISIVNASKISNLDTIEEDYLIIDDKRVCFNINTKNEYDLLGSI